MVSLTQKEEPVNVGRKLGGPDRTQFGKEKHFLFLLGFETQIVQPVACTQYTDYARSQTFTCLVQNLPCVSRTGI